MAQYISDIAFTPSVKAIQAERGSRAAYARMAERSDWKVEITPMLLDFLAERDSIYLATATADGQPYVQHRGGPPGFVRAIDETTLAFADFSGNSQFITVGNLSENHRAFLFLMDYPNRRRIKVWGRAEIVADDPALLARLVDPTYKAKVERAIVFHIEAWDVNCPKHIVPRFTETQMAPILTELQSRIAELEGINECLRERLAYYSAPGARPHREDSALAPLR